MRRRQHAVWKQNGIYLLGRPRRWKNRVPTYLPSHQCPLPLLSKTRIALYQQAAISRNGIQNPTGILPWRTGASHDRKMTSGVSEPDTNRAELISTSDGHNLFMILSGRVSVVSPATESTKIEQKGEWLWRTHISMAFIFILLLTASCSTKDSAHINVTGRRDGFGDCGTIRYGASNSGRVLHSGKALISIHWPTHRRSYGNIEGSGATLYYKVS